MVKNSIWGQRKTGFPLSDIFWDIPTLNGHSSAPNGPNKPGIFSTAQANTAHSFTSKILLAVRDIDN